MKRKIVVTAWVSFVIGGGLFAMCYYGKPPLLAAVLLIIGFGGFGGMAIDFIWE